MNGLIEPRLIIAEIERCRAGGIEQQVQVIPAREWEDKIVQTQVEKIESKQAGAEAEVETAQRALQVALASQDTEAVARAQWELAQAEAERLELSGQMDTFIGSPRSQQVSRSMAALEMWTDTVTASPPAAHRKGAAAEGAAVGEAALSESTLGADEEARLQAKQRDRRGSKDRGQNWREKSNLAAGKAVEDRQLKSQKRQMASQIDNLQKSAELAAEETEQLKEQAAQELADALKAGELASSERDGLAQQVELLKETAEDSGVVASYADSMNNSYEARLSEMNAEVLALQTTILQLKQEKQVSVTQVEKLEAHEQELETTVAELTEDQRQAALRLDKTVEELKETSAQVEELEAAENELEATVEELEQDLADKAKELKESQSEHANTTAELMGAQQAAKTVSNERDVLLLQVQASEAGDEVTALADSMKEAYEAQLKEMNEELL